MRKYLIGLVVAGMLGVAGCSTVTEEGYRQKTNAMVGLGADALEAQWGLPYAKATLTDGAELWAYRRSHVVRYESSFRFENTSYSTTFKDKNDVKHTEYRTSSKPEYTPPSASWRHCETRFVVGIDQKVRSVTFDGNDCLAEEKGTPSRDLENDEGAVK